ncbi:3'-5' exonuclease [Tsuneonella troitsensis]|uniref:3'-5' exonuclease n=1 Tax=Tsuneonella troitsensis TaxID=292222 RepID=UPI0009F8229A
MFLFFDTETTGLSKASDRIVQIAWVVATREGRIEREESHIIKPEGFSIPTQASRIHGITTEAAQRLGRDRRTILSRFLSDARPVTCVVAHNMSFDLGMLRSDLNRSGLACEIDTKNHICTMALSTAWCELPKPRGGTGHKWPKLEELHYKIFGHYFENAHDALADAHATRKCFFELVRRKVITPPPENTEPLPEYSPDPELPAWRVPPSQGFSSRAAERIRRQQEHVLEGGFAMRSGKVYPVCPICDQAVRVPLNRHLEIICPSCRQKWRVRT